MAAPSTSSAKDSYIRSISDSEISKQKAEHGYKNMHEILDEFEIRSDPTTGCELADLERQRLRWTHIHPDHWSSVEVASWLNFVADEHGFTHDERASTLESFESTTGPQLFRMTRDDFLVTDPAKGGILFEVLKRIYPAGFPATLELHGNKEPLPSVTEDSGSATSREPSPTPCDTLK